MISTCLFHFEGTILFSRVCVVTLSLYVASIPDIYLYSMLSFMLKKMKSSSSSLAESSLKTTLRYIFFPLRLQYFFEFYLCIKMSVRICVIVKNCFGKVLWKNQLVEAATRRISCYPHLFRSASYLFTSISL